MHISSQLTTQRQQILQTRLYQSPYVASLTFKTYFSQ